MEKQFCNVEEIKERLKKNQLNIFDLIGEE